jgi:hypothetical protein
MALYESLTAQSTPDQIAAAYKEFTGMVGGDTQDAQTRAVDYLSGLGIAAPTITQGYNQYLNPTVGAVDTSGALSSSAVPAAPAAPLYAGLTAQSTPDQIAGAYSQFLDTAGGDTAANQQTALAYLNKLGVAAPTTTKAYEVYRSDQPLYKSLTSSSAADEIARAYYQFAGGAGGDNQTNQQEAVAYLQKLGISDPMIESGYKDFGRLTELKDDLVSSFGVEGGQAAPTQEGILSGFKYANNNKISEKDMEQVLGKDAFNTYKTGFADYAKTGIANILADKQLSFDEAREAVKFGRDYGYDAQKLADLTGTNKRVFDAIYKNYDDTTNRVVDSVLGAEDVKTDADKIFKSLQLQNKFGFTDEDLAKATDLSLDQVKGYLDPVRNYEADYKKIIENPKLSLDQVEDQMRTFLGSSLQNPFLKEKLGDKLQPVLDELNRPPRERILSQIDQQRNVLGGNYYRGVFGDPENMANVLEKKGVKSLADIEQKDKFEAVPAEKRYFAPDGTPLVYDGSQGVYGQQDGEGGMAFTVPKNQVRTVYGRTESAMNPDGETSTSTFIEIPESELDKDGNYQALVGKVAVNKRTGEEISDLNGQIAGQSSSGGLKKKYNTLNVGFDKNGTAILTASSQRSGLGGLAQDLAPMISMALPFVLPGLGAGLSSMLPGAGVAASGATAAIAPTLMNQALTQGIISGGLTSLGGGQFEKGFLSGAVNPVISTGINSLLPAGLSENATNAIRGAGTNVIKGALQGESFEDLLGQGVLSGLSNYGLNAAIGSSGLTPQQVNFATGIALPLLQGQKVNPMNVIGSLAQMGQQQRQKSNSNVDFGGGGDDIDALMGGGDVGGGDFYDGNDSGNLGYNQPLDQQSLNNTFTGNGPSNFYGANMTGNSNDQSLIAQLAQIVSRGVPLGGGYIKPARVSSGYGARWSKQFNEGGMVNADQQMQRTTS